jgi:hypothetical protein
MESPFNGKGPSMANNNGTLKKGSSMAKALPWQRLGHFESKGKALRRQMQ